MTDTNYIQVVRRIAFCEDCDAPDTEEKVMKRQVGHRGNEPILCALCADKRRAILPQRLGSQPPPHPPRPYTSSQNADNAVSEWDSIQVG